MYVSGTNAEEYSYRHISVYDRPEDGTNVPILNWELKNLSGSRNDGGYSASIRVRTDVSGIRDGALVVIFSDDWYGDTKQDNILFNGYILEGSIEFNWQDGFVEFEIGSPTKVMQQIEGFAISAESKTTPSTWFEIKNLDCEKAVYHYLKWHSTALMCNDLEFSGSNYNIQYFDSDRESIYSAIQNFMENTLVGSFVSDRLGKCWIETDIKAINGATGEFYHSDLKITKPRWIGSPILTVRTRPDISYLEMGGIKYNGPASDTFEALLSMSPGDAPSYGGSPSRRQGLALSGQSQLNRLCGNVYAWENSRYPSIQFRLSGNYRNFDIAPIEILDVTIETTDTPMGISFSEKPFSIQEMAFDYGNQTLLPTIVVSEVTQGIVGETLIIPTTPPTGGGTYGGGFLIPPFEFPPIDIGIFGNPFTLYDEGSLLGVISALDIVGVPATATIDGSVGTITFSCPDCGFSSAVYAKTTSAVRQFDAFNPVPIDLYIGKFATTSGMGKTDTTLIANLDGLYSITVDSTTNVFLTSPATDGKEYQTSHTIAIYDSGGTLKESIYQNSATLTGNGDGFAYLSISLNMTTYMVAGDYMKLIAGLVTDDPTPVVTIEPKIVSIYKA